MIKAIIGHTFEIAFGKKQPAAHDKRQNDAGPCPRISPLRQALLADGIADGLLETGLEPLGHLINATLQARVFADQRVAHQHAGHTGVLLGKGQQHGDNRPQLAQPVRLLGRNLVDQGKNAAFDEVDQPFEHLRLAGKVPVQRGFGHLQPACQCRRGHPV